MTTERSSDSEGPLLELRRLAKRFGPVRALQGIDLGLREGEILGLLGPNGSGKSTLLRILCGLVEPDAGEVVWRGRRIGFPYPEIRRRCGALIERPALFPYMSARENVELSARYSGVALSAERADGLLERVGLHPARRDAVARFSQGMKQRLGVALALVNDPELLILDEPFNALDPAGVKSMRALLRRLSRDERVTILLSSHQLHEVEFACERVAVLDRGAVRRAGTLAELHRGRRCRYLLECSRVDFASKLLSDKRIEAAGDGALSVWLTDEEAPRVVERLVRSDVAVHRFAPQQRLEDLLESLEAAPE